MTLRHTTITTAIGELTLVADGGALTGVYFPGHWHPPVAGTIGAAVDAETDPLFVAVRTELGEYLAGDRTTFDVPVRTTGDAFHEQVWAMLRELPFGVTTTYGELAERLGDRTLARRVGQAVGRNPVSILIGCHRVVGKDGALTGYAGGLERKRRLLELEGALVERTLF
ncbi:methylated-DNA--[protein]-cysteine S-methyltransferase [Glaciibacter flavus]|uniref:methylated-DNA--[protein]-cysteine S-methyltransferase n=1 Tax=Orlajensenia flava TaxID=2565934 RepID=UPI003B009CCF